MWICVVWWIHSSTFVRNFSLDDGGTVSLFSVDDDDDNNNNNNNNNIYLLDLGCHPVSVVILHVNKT